MHKEYELLKQRYIQGWQTWNVRSVLSHVKMPQGFALNLAVKEYAVGGYLKEALIGRFEKDAEQVFPGPHAYDASYTRLKISWRGIEFTVETSAQDENLVMLVTPHSQPAKAPVLYLEAGFLWNRPGSVALEDGALCARSGSWQTRVFTTGAPAAYDGNAPTQAPYLAVPMTGEVAFSAGQAVSVAQARALLDEKRAALEAQWARYGENAPLFEAMQCALSWDTIYDPNQNRVISPVSRLWSIRSGGYTLFCWDNYFAGFMASIGSRELGYSNLIEITREHTQAGFVPNFVYGTGLKSEDRSQPPVGSAMALEVYRMHGDKWLLEYLYPMLLKWNTWFVENRMNESGALCWGSNPIEVAYGNSWERDGVHDTFGGALESGLDNSPMYDGIPFDKARNRMMLEDVGLTGLFILDCGALMEIAAILGKTEDTPALRERMERAERGLATLWDEENGFFYNRRTDTGEFSRRISPTNFYALFSSRVSGEQARRMVSEHYMNPEEFYGKYMLPSIARNDPAYPDQDYWRGRIWAPMNFLAYMALRRHGQSDACADLARKSQQLMMAEWREHGHIHENYNGDTGSGCDVRNSDKFYHWGALLAVIALVEAGDLAGFDERR